MNCSRILRAPVVTLLSPSLSASQRALELLSILGNLDDITLEGTAGDALDEAFQSSIPYLSRSWVSVASKCAISGSIIHLCSMAQSNAGDITNMLRSARFELLAITDTETTVDVEVNNQVPATNSAVDSVLNARRLLASPFTNMGLSAASTIISLKQSIRGLTAGDILKQNGTQGGLPFTAITDVIDDIAWKENRSNKGESSTPIHLKEVVVPFLEYGAYADGSTLLSRLGTAKLKREAVGVYRWPNSITSVRPLPSGAEDQRLPSPSLIFHCESPHDASRRLTETTGIKAARIGYGGLGDGQMMLLHENLAGLDVRYCPRNTVSSSFSEAQESLLAGSLKELQSTNVLLASGEEAHDDDRIGKGDCWVEVRANMKHPFGYWRRRKGSLTSQRVAKAPDVPYE